MRNHERNKEKSRGSRRNGISIKTLAYKNATKAKFATILKLKLLRL